MKSLKVNTNPTILFFLISIYITITYSTLGWGNAWGAILFREDAYFETVGVVSLFMASIIMFVVFFQAFRSRNETNIKLIKLLAYFGLAFLFFFGAGEEISWGQRIFNIETPAEIAAQNVQGEINFHNLKAFEGGQIEAEEVFTLFWMGYTVVLPCLALIWRRFQGSVEEYIPIPHWAIGILFTYTYFGAKVAKIIYIVVYDYARVPFVQALQEIKESNYTLLFVPLALSLLWDLRKHKLKNE